MLNKTTIKISNKIIIFLNKDFFWGEGGGELEKSTFVTLFQITNFIEPLKYLYEEKVRRKKYEIIN